MIKIQKKRYYERILVVGKVQKKEVIEKEILDEGYTITSKTYGGRERFKKDSSKIKLTAEREVLISEVPK